MKKVICTVINDLSYDQRMHRICGALTDAGYKVILVGRRLPNSIDLPQQPFEQKRLKCLVNSGKLFYLEYNLRIFIFLMLRSFDAVCSIDLDTLLAGYFSSKIKGKTCIFDAHEYFQEVPELVNRPVSKRIWETIASFVIPKLKYCYTVSPGLAAIFSKKYSTPFGTIMNVPYKESFEETDNGNFPETENKIILYQGALNEGRGLEVAIESVATLDGIEFWLAGEGDLSLELRELAKTLGVSHKVKFLGYLLPGKLKQLTPMAYLGYNLLENKGLSYYHSLANKFFDYLHAGVPTLNPDFPEYFAINKEYDVSYLVTSLTPKEVCKVIQSALSDIDRYNSLKQNCKKASHVLNWEHEKNKLLAIYDKALG